MHFLGRPLGTGEGCVGWDFGADTTAASRWLYAPGLLACTPRLLRAASPTALFKGAHAACACVRAGVASHSGRW